MSDVFRCADRWQRDIALTEQCWRLHVLNRRTYFRGHEAAVREALTDPLFVRHDAAFANRECFYRASSLPAPYERFFIKVVVEFRFDPVVAHETGEVVTVYVTDREKPGEEQKWP